MGFQHLPGISRPIVTPVPVLMPSSGLHGYVDIYVVFIYTSTHKYIYIHTCKHIYTYTHTNKCVHTYTHNMYTYIHIRTNIQTYAKHIHKIINE